MTAFGCELATIAMQQMAHLSATRATSSAARALFRKDGAVCASALICSSVCQAEPYLW